MSPPTQPDAPTFAPHASLPPSAWITRFAHLVPARGEVLDVACGSGRHLRWFAAQGHLVVGVDRSDTALAAAKGVGELVQADIENDPWPFADRRFAAVIVTNYLWRPLLATLIDSVAPGGVLLYETFAVGNESVGKPSNPDFLLRPGELLTACAALRVVAYEGRLPNRSATLRAADRNGARAGRTRGRASPSAPLIPSLPSTWLQAHSGQPAGQITAAIHPRRPAAETKTRCSRAADSARTR